MEQENQLKLQKLQFTSMNFNKENMPLQPNNHSKKDSL